MTARLRFWILALALLGGVVCGQEEDGVRFVFEGNEGIDSTALAGWIGPEVRRYEEKDRSRAVLDDAAFLLARGYRRRGYQEVRVEFEVILSDGSEVLFRIEEGDLWRLDGPIEFDPPIEEEAFRTWWAKSSTYALTRKVLDYPVLDENDIRNDLDRADDLLVELGYPEVKLTPEIVEVTPGSPRWGILPPRRGVRRMHARVAVDLGPRFVVGAVRFEGDLGFEPTVLLQRLGLEPPLASAPVYYPDRVIDWKLAIARFYREEGHRNARVVSREPEFVSLPDGTRRADLLLSIEPGPHFRVREVRVKGNERTRDGVIRRVLGIAPGDPYSGKFQREGRSDLLALELFGTVTVEDVDVPGATDQVDIEVRVEEKPARILGFDVGIGLLDRVRAGLDLELNNLFGSGMGLELSGDVSSRRRRVEFVFHDPFPLGDSKGNLRVGPFVERFDIEPFTVNRIGALLDYRRPIGEDLRLRLGGSWEFSDLRDVGDGLEIAGEGDHFFSGPTAGLTWDRRDDAAFPSEGWILRLGLSSSVRALGATKDLIGGEFGLGAYLPVATFQGHPVVLFTGVEARAVRALGSRGSVPIQRRLFLGGPASVRSFAAERLGPLNFLDTPEGGELSLLATVEMRANLFGDLWGVVFVDAGLVESRLDRYSDEEPGFAIGAGLRYRTPVGPIRLEIGFNPDPSRGQEEDLFEIVFAIGFRF